MKPEKPAEQTKTKRSKSDGSVRVSIPTVVLTREEAEGLAFERAGALPGKHRSVAAMARKQVRDLCGKPTAIITGAVNKLRNARFEAELRAKRAERDRIEAELKELQARSMEAEVPEPASSTRTDRKSITGTSNATDDAAGG